jgi:hypothetical protein
MRKRAWLLTVLVLSLAVASAGLAAPAGANGYTLLLSVKSERVNHSFVQWRDIANAQPGSTLYNDIVRWATRVKGLGAHVYFTFNHEPETALNTSGTGADFIAAWRKVVTVFREQGVTNADYLWIMTAFSFKAKDRRRAVDWYPGEAYLDYIGADAYNWYTCRPGTKNPWNSLESLLNPMRQFGQGKAIKGIVVSEWASTEDPAQPRPSPTARPSGSPTPAPCSRSPAGSPSRGSSTTTSPRSSPTAAGSSTPARPP